MILCKGNFIIVKLWSGVCYDVIVIERILLSDLIPGDLIVNNHYPVTYLWVIVSVVSVDQHRLQLGYLSRGGTIHYRIEAHQRSKCVDEFVVRHR